MQRSFADELRDHERKYPFFKLVRPVGGVVEGPVSLRQVDLSAPEFMVFSAGLGNLTMTSPAVVEMSGRAVGIIGGAGSDEKVELALLRSIAESAERYATCIFSDESSIVASANELGADALDLDTLPRCSKIELADPLCIIRPPDKSLPIRWIKGWSLTQRKTIWIPRLLTHLYSASLPGENFTFPITTGVAAHTDIVRAITTAIGEVVERDAIAMTWLAKLQLPKLEFDREIPQASREKFDRLGASWIKQHFFDATSDVGLPTVYTVQALDTHPTLARFVSCSSEFDFLAACGKVVREAASGRLAFEYGFDIPDDIRDFKALEEGAAYMGRPEHRHAFDFLTESTRRSSLGARLDEPYPETDVGRLELLLQRFRRMGMEVAVADLTTDELRAVGLWAVRVVIPQLMPMSTFYRSRFLAHPRLYDYPKSAGFGALTEADVNPYPQPFA